VAALVKPLNLVVEAAFVGIFAKHSERRFAIDTYETLGELTASPHIGGAMVGWRRGERQPESSSAPDT